MALTIPFQSAAHAKPLAVKTTAASGLFRVKSEVPEAIPCFAAAQASRVPLGGSASGVSMKRSASFDEAPVTKAPKRSRTEEGRINELLSISSALDSGNAERVVRALHMCKDLRVVYQEASRYGRLGKKVIQIRMKSSDENQNALATWLEKQWRQQKRSTNADYFEDGLSMEMLPANITNLSAASVVVDPLDAQQHVLKACERETLDLHQFDDVELE